MKSTRLVLTAFSFAVSSLCAADKPRPITQTFYVSGVECGSCVYMVQQAVSAVKGVSEVTVVQVVDNYANVTFDPNIVSIHQIAQAVTDAAPLHGIPYQATLKLFIPDYAKENNSRKVDALFSKWKSWVEIETADRASGEFILRFQPLTIDARMTDPQGLRHEDLFQALQSPSPQGLGLKIRIAEEKVDG